MNLNSCNADLATIVGAITSAISKFGLPSFELLPGVEAEVALDVEYKFNSNVKILYDVKSSSCFKIDVRSRTDATKGGIAEASFLNTMKLKSITLPPEFDLLDPKDIEIVFDSGLTVQVSREGTSVDVSSFWEMFLPAILRK